MARRFASCAHNRRSRGDYASRAARAARATAARPGRSARALSAPPLQSSLASQRIYFVMPDRYANGEPANDTRRAERGRGRRPASTRRTRATTTAATCRGSTQNLKRIHDLGFTALWVTPVLKQQTVSQGTAAYHGYWGLDFTTVDPHLGTDQDFASSSPPRTRSG